jgi:transposase InsO family protein
VEDVGTTLTLPTEVFVTHANAPLTPEGRRRLAVLIVDRGWSVRRAAERFQVAPATASKWAARYRAGLSMADRSSCPQRSPSRLSRRLEHRIVALRFSRRWGPHRIGYHLGLQHSTVGRVLTRYRMPLLQHLDHGTGLPVRKRPATRIVTTHAGELVHVDIKKLGRIPDGGGHRAFGRVTGNRNNKKHGRGYAFLHHAIDAYSRLVYSEQHLDERRETAAGFWTRANEYFARHGITVEKVMTDNGSCYRSHVFAAALDGIRHVRTRPYRPQTNGKVERFNRTLATEWAYVGVFTSDEARSATYADWIHFYNHHRPHAGLGGQVPASRVHNLTGNYS